MFLRKQLLLLKFLKVPAVVSVLMVGTYSQTKSRGDSSDWWSINRDDPGRPFAASSAKELKASNFEIAGLTLGADVDAIGVRLGKATAIDRGDASTGRSQVCYRLNESALTHLIFEFGADESVLYLRHQSHGKVKDPAPYPDAI
jgi:hypothetical protein